MIRYVITLDADTQMARGDVYRMVGAMAHPLNRPRLEHGRVVEGYGIMQPRITPSLPAAGSGTLYQRTFSGPSGLDPYAFAVSDVYQDLFGEGSYTGKGIYDVDAFESALANKSLPNTLLSHDLFEGNYARAGLLSDIELFEAYPARYESATLRNHRWVRGDWQLLPYLFSPGLPLISRVKMVDNLRRSLVSPSLFLMLLTAWMPGVQPSIAWMWTLCALAVLSVPSLMSPLTHLWARRRTILQELRLGLWQIFFGVTFLVY
jgi:cyclic beta-1,2-glucan synthetase